MSVRAYRIEKVSKNMSFNCWHDEDIMNVADLTNYDGGGLIYLEKDKVLKLIKSHKAKLRKVAGEEREILETRIADLKEIVEEMVDEDYSEYLCY